MPVRLFFVLVLTAVVVNSVPATAGTLLEEGTVRVKRLQHSPIIFPALDSSLGENIQGPSLIKAPPWIDKPLGNYYLYFADHKGSYIRLAYADVLTGPWQIHTPGSLQLSQTSFSQEAQSLTAQEIDTFKERARKAGFDLDSLPHDLIKELTQPHIASPDVHVDAINQRVVMYFHGLKSPGHQVSRVATSSDGINFTASSEDLGKTYMRIFTHNDLTYALAMPGQFYRSQDGMSNFEKGPLLFNKDMRHAGLLKRDSTLLVFWTQVGHVPERILLSRVDLTKPWMQWTASDPVEVLRPEFDWEGADAPLQPSVRSSSHGHVNQLRDPCIFEENGKIYLLYAVAGESGIAIAEIDPDSL